GVAVRPGHPVILGMGKGQVAEGKAREVPIVGVPGYPVSAAFTVDIFVEPLVARWLGRPPYEPQIQEATLTRKIASPGGDDEYVRVVAGEVGGRILAAPLSRGAGVISSLSQADGVVVIPRGEQGVEAGQKVQVRLLRPPAELHQTIFCIGSHDVILDLLAQHLAQSGRRLISSNVGSQGGLVALRRGEAHVAGSHLLDPLTGQYNFPYLKQYLGDLEVRLVTLVHRAQGLMVPRGNPKGVTGIADLKRGDVRIVNRQRGAGTRVLLDYQLDLLGISAGQILGYNQEEYTHLAVAAAVASGRADCGLGIAAAAQALDLDFVPLFQERYDLVIPLQYWDTDLMAPLFAALQDTGFRQSVAALPGYDISRMGESPVED
ncbi:MAG TPA: substrate-binding domain-containing protein, partial [Anaerolineales bacterium]